MLTEKQEDPEENVGKVVPKSKLIEITLHFNEGIGTGLDTTLPEFGSVTNRTLEALRDVKRKKVSCLKILIKNDPKTQNRLNAFIERLDRYKADNLWRPYRDAKGTPLCGYLKMVPRKTVESYSDGLFRYPAQNSFACLEEARIKLSYGVFLEHRQKRSQLYRKYKNQTPNRSVDDFVQYQLEALSCVYGRTPNEWTATLLNHEVMALPITDPLGGTPGLNEDGIAQKRKGVLKAFPWNEDQIRAVDSTRSSRGRVGIIVGPSGTGRTTTLAGIACLYKACGASVMMFAPSPSAATALADTFRALCIKALGSLPTEDLCVLVSNESSYMDLIRERQTGRPFKPTVMVTTPNTVCYTNIFRKFEKRARAVIILHDDAFHITEPEMLATIFAIKSPTKRLGLVCVMDLKEWYIDISTQTDPTRQMRRKDEKSSSHFTQFLNFFYHATLKDGSHPTNLKGFEPKGEFDFVYGRNEFADQLGLSLPARLLRQGFPATVLRKQERMAIKLTKFPYHRSYKSIQPPPNFIYRDSMVTPAISNIVAKWLGKESLRAPVLFVKVPNSICVKDYEHTKSKRNEPNAATVADLLAAIFRSTDKALSQTALITPYADQCRIHNDAVLPKLARSLSADINQLPEARTVDSMRGREAKYVIYDLVVTSSDKSHGIGIVMDNYLAHLALTRAQEMFIIFGSEKLLTVFPSFWVCLNQFDGKPGRELPYIAEYVRELAEYGLDFTAPVVEVPKYNYVAPDWAHREDTEFDAYWERDFAREEGVY